MAKTKKTVSVDDILDSAAKAPSKKGASDVAVVNITNNKELNDKVANFAKAKRQVNAATCIIKSLSDDIREDGFAHIVRQSINSNKPTKSVTLESTDGAVMVSTSYSASEIPTDQEENIKEKCEDLNVNYEQHFKKERVITLKPDITDEDLKELIQMVQKKFGDQGFAKIFSVERWIEPTEKFYNALLMGESKVTSLYNELGPKSSEKVIKMKAPSLELVVAKADKAKQEAV